MNPVLCTLAPRRGYNSIASTVLQEIFKDQKLIRENSPFIAMSPNAFLTIAANADLEMKMSKAGPYMLACFKDSSAILTRLVPFQVLPLTLHENNAHKTLLEKLNPFHPKHKHLIGMMDETWQKHANSKFLERTTDTSAYPTKGYQWSDYDSYSESSVIINPANPLQDADKIRDKMMFLSIIQQVFEEPIQDDCVYQLRRHIFSSNSQISLQKRNNIKRPLITTARLPKWAIHIIIKNLPAFREEIGSGWWKNTGKIEDLANNASIIYYSKHTSLSAHDHMNIRKNKDAFSHCLSKPELKKWEKALSRKSIKTSS